MFKDRKSLKMKGGRFIRGRTFITKLTVLALSVILSALFLAPAYAETTETKVADPDTYNSYKVADTKDAIGQVWTDKSVYAGDENSDFLVALSALSSTSNKMVSTTKPLDIVLVLDVSGSMVELLPGGVQKIVALKIAVSNFINATVVQNSGLPDNLKHRIALVKFAGEKTDIVGNNVDYRGYNYSQIVSDLAVADAPYACNLKCELGKLYAAGETSADYGMQHAQTVLKDARPEAQKVVIFFTDGEPNHGSGFDRSVANDTIKIAKDIKEDGSLIYTIGLFNGACPKDTKYPFNAYMHGVSSNYPEATTYRKLGPRAEDSDYYKATYDACELKNIFDEIASEIITTPYAPPVKTDLDLDASGYVTFTDQLGAYMQVDGFKNIVVNGTEFSECTASTEAGITTYTFTGEHAGNILSPESTLDKVLITVKSDADCSVGDTVKVEIPASLLPLSTYKIDLDETVTHTFEATPISIVYGVSLKDCARERLAKPDEAMNAYVKANIEDNNVYFYSNAFDGSDTGTTTATFEPADNNAYYDGFEEAKEAKTENLTETAANAAVFAAGQTNLGNNGRLSIAYVGSLVVSKTVVIPEGLTPAADEFIFTVHVDGAMGDFSTGDGTITFDKDGNATITLKHNERVTIEGLPAHAAYKVTEKVPDGFSAVMIDSGTIPFDGGSIVGCTNTYAVDPYTTGADDGLVATKKLEGKKLAAGDFTFKVERMSPNDPPMPATETVTNDADGNIDFGPVTFTKPGTYMYKVSEVDGGQVGYTYDGMVYTVTYVVNDNGHGKLEATRTITADKEQFDGMVFKNSYKKPAPLPITPATGDPLPVVALLVSSMAALVVLTVTGFGVRRFNKRH